MVKHAVKILLYYLETKATKYSYVELVLFSSCHPGGPLRYKLSPLFLYVMTAPRARLFLPYTDRSRTEKIINTKWSTHFDFARLHIMGEFEQLTCQAKRYVSMLFTSLFFIIA